MPQTPTGYAVLKGSERRVVRDAELIRRTEQGEELTISIHLRRNPEAKPLAGHEDWVSNNPPLMTRDNFADAYSSTEADIDAIRDFAKTHNLTIVDIGPVRRTITASGSVADISRAFAVELNHYRVGTTEYRGRTGHIHIPEALAPIVTGVFGLDNRPMARPASAGFGPFPPHHLTVSQLMDYYDFPATNNGAGQTIGILGFAPCGYVPSDLKLFFDNLGVPQPQIVDVNINGAKNTPGNEGYDEEVTMDIEIAAGTAPGASIAVYFTSKDENGWVQAIEAAVHPEQGQPAPSVISISWDWAEFGTFDAHWSWTAAAMSAVSETLQEAACLGISVFVAAGDNGTNCVVGDGKAHVYYPASDPWVTSCGGTSFVLNGFDGSIATESTWSDTGGGISDFFDLPAWQAGAGVPPSVNGDGRIGRGIPDVAAGAVPGLQIAFGNELIDSGGGTSQVAPFLAGLIARLNSETGNRAGFLNPTLYRLGGTALFRDMNDGVDNSGFYRKSDGTVGRSPGYSSGSGWDACGGWGCIDAKELLKALSGQGKYRD